MLHGLGQMWVHESHPHPSESWCSYKCEFNGSLWGFSQSSHTTGRDTADLFLSTLGTGNSSHGYRNSPGQPETHSLLLICLLPPTGKAYSLGRAEYGRLGLGEGAEEKSIPTLISRLPAVSSVACGASVGYAVTKDGEWGCSYWVWLGPGVAVLTKLPSRL